MKRKAKPCNKTLLTILCLLCLNPALLYAQSAAVEMQSLLASGAVTYAQASRFVLEASDMAFFAENEDAFRFAVERNMLPRRSAAGSEARLDSISLLLMRSFEIRGGVLYTLTGARRFAYREMEHRGVLHGRISPRQNVSGEELLYLTGRMLAYIEVQLGVAEEMEEMRLRAEAARLAEALDAERLAAEAHEDARREAEHREAEQAAALQLAEQQAAALQMAEQAAALPHIRFYAESTVIPAAQRPALHEIAALLRGVPGRIAVCGHSAMAGNMEGRIYISTARAQAVADYLVNLGVRRREEIVVTGHGAAFPIADNDTPEGMALNRRVEITVVE